MVSVLSNRSEGLARQSQEGLRQLILRLQRISEAEKTRICRVLHDELGQALTAMKLDLFWIKDRLGDDLSELRVRADEMEDLLNQTLATVRRLHSELRPAMLDHLGLASALQWQAKEFERQSSIVCALHMETSEQALDADLSTAVYRSYQEALANVAQHAAATHVDIRYRTEDDVLHLAVEDDGVGFVPGELSEASSLGLLCMRERIRHLGGQMEISSSPGKGTRVCWEIPIDGGSRGQ
jgi:signal transduction histidine kinase